MTEFHKLPFSRTRTIFGLRCPECGQGPLLKGMLSQRESCPVCGHDFTRYGGADGPAYISILLVSTLVCILASWIEIAYSPPYWLHALIWFPLIIILSLLCLRYAKGFMVAAHYKHRTSEPRDLTEHRQARENPASAPHTDAQS